MDDATGEDDFEYDQDEICATEENEAIDFDFTNVEPGTPWESDELCWQEELWDDAAYNEQHENASPDEEYEEV